MCRNWRATHLLKPFVFTKTVTQDGRERCQRQGQEEGRVKRYTAILRSIFSHFVRETSTTTCDFTLYVYHSNHCETSWSGGPHDFSHAHSDAVASYIWSYVMAPVWLAVKERDECRGGNHGRNMTHGSCCFVYQGHLRSTALWWVQTPRDNPSSKTARVWSYISNTQ